MFINRRGKKTVMSSRIKTPLIAINFKTYASATGAKGVALAKICQSVAKQKRASIIISVQTPDIYRVSSKVKIPVFAEHVDGVEFGAHTGKVLAQSIKEDGAIGTLLNHSEDQYSWKELVAAVERCKEAKLNIIICADTIAKAKRVATLKPDFVAYEPPELIGGDVSVTTRPQAIVKVVRAIRSVNKTVGILVGAGVKTGEDVRIAIKLKTQGVLLASGVAASKNPKAALINLCAGLRK